MNTNRPGQDELNLAWARDSVRTLIENGVRHCVLCPGSRSSALVLAVHEQHHILETTVHFDERAAAFFALGIALGSARPVMMIVTSGTAVANVLPAVVEASLSHVPLIICSADRPPELRDTEANQTITQPHIFGANVRWFFDLPCPSVDVDQKRFLSSTMRHAVSRATQVDPGPVHLNFMFREPLVPTADRVCPPGLASPDSSTVSVQIRGEALAWPQELEQRIRSVSRGLLIVGQLAGAAERVAAIDLANALGWPVLADVTSGVKHLAGPVSLIGHYDLLLSDGDFSQALAPELVVHLGGRIVSKSLAQYMRRCAPATYVLLQAHPRRHDPDFLVTHTVVGSLAVHGGAIASQLSCAEVDPAWVDAWTEADQRLAAGLDRVIGAEPLSELSVTRWISRELRASHGLFLSNSLPIREMDMVGAPFSAAIPLAANRGASGIDGIVASAAGFARGLNHPVVLIVGDLALLHDLNSLALLRAGPPVTLVVFNNDGGGIFSILPIADHASVFERFFGTPHGISFEQAAGMFGLDYMNPTRQDEFASAFQSRMGAAASGIIEIKTSRIENADRIRALRGRARQA